MSKQPAKPVTTGPRFGRATGFELASRDQPGEANIEAALDRNRAFAVAGGHQGAVVFPNLRLFVITCLDPRVDDTFRRRYAERIGVDESTLLDHAVLNPAATIIDDVERLRSASAISPRIAVSGHIYDVLTGLVETVIPQAAAE